jgi:hypothetical protein
MSENVALIVDQDGTGHLAEVTSGPDGCFSFTMPQGVTSAAVSFPLARSVAAPPAREPVA